MRGSFRQSMAWLHTWTGLLAGWFLLLIFLSGTTAYFRSEITRWMSPEQTAPVASNIAARNALAWLNANHPGAVAWDVYLPDMRGGPVFVYWTPKPEDGRDAVRDWEANTAALDAATGKAVATRETEGGDFFYRFHFDLHYLPVVWARWIVGFCAMVMLIACITGIVTHKKIFADFFMLRFGKGQRSWLDAHNVSAVVALPFILMITYTGLVTLAALYMPWPIKASALSDSEFYNAVYPSPPPRAAQGRAAPMVSLDEIFDTAHARWNRTGVSHLGISHPGDAASTIVASSASDARIQTVTSTIQFDGVTGAVLWASPHIGAEVATKGALVGLHAGRFAGVALRWLYFLSGLGGAAMIATGLVLWTSKRRLKLPDPERPHFGFRLVEKLNIGVIAGFPCGMATYFLANRLLPLDMHDRAEWEINALFVVWGAVLIWAFGRTPKKAWVETLGASAGLFGAVPLANALTTPRGLPASLWAGDLVYIAFDSVMLAVAAVLGFTASKVHRHKPIIKLKKPTRTASEEPTT